MMAKTLCALAEQELNDGHRVRAVGTIRALRGVLSDIALMISGDACSVSSSDLREAQDLRTGLEERIAAMEMAIGPETVH